MTETKNVKNDSLVAAIRAHGAVARRKDLLASGFTAWNLKRAESAQLIKRVAPGYVALPDADPMDIELAHLQATRACFSKVTSMGLWLLEEPKKLHVASAHGRPIPGCVVHRVKGELTLMEVLRQCVKCGTQLEALVVLESAVVKDKCSFNSLRRAFTGREDSAGRKIVDMIDPQSMSAPEVCGRYHLRQKGYNVQGQAYIRTAGHLDLLVEGVLGIELDSRKFHNTDAGWKEDLRRDTMFVINGVWRLRIPAEVALYHPEIMLRWVEQALSSINSTSNSR